MKTVELRIDSKSGKLTTKEEASTNSRHATREEFNPDFILRHVINSKHGFKTDSIEVKISTRLTVEVYTNSLRYVLFKQNPICVCCGRKITYARLTFGKHSSHNKVRGHFNFFSEDNVLITKDHIVPKSLGGEDSLENYQTMCYQCNVKKGATIVKY